jgi:hypothetical protein
VNPFERGEIGPEGGVLDGARGLVSKRRDRRPVETLGEDQDALGPAMNRVMEAFG